VSRICTFLIVVVVLLCGGLARADEAIRQVQEELRKRNMFHGDVDGRETPGFLDALKRYQQRKGFPPTGVADLDTMRSMGLSGPPATTELPNVPVLRSDRSPGLVAGRELSATAAMALRPAGANKTPPTPQEARRFIREYLEACASPDVADELAFYGARVDYFHHGAVDQNYIRTLLLAYYQQWPERRYTMGDSVRIGQSGGYATAKCRISFTLASGKRQASGRTDNTFILARRADNRLEIIGHQEARVRPAARSRSTKQRGKKERLTPLDRTLRKFFGKPAKQKSPRKRR
jgi:hypothetical protein